MLLILVIFALLGALLVAGIVFLAHGSVAKTKWGINLEQPACPRCQAAMPSVRAPRSLKQALWGGSKCASCGCEMDKWGREI